MSTSLPSSLPSTTTVGQENENENGNEVYFNFINSIKSPVTKRIYEDNVKVFMKFCNVSNLVDLLKIDAQRHIIKFTMSLRESGLASNSISVRLNSIFHFYAMNDVVLNKNKINESSKMSRTRM